MTVGQGFKFSVFFHCAVAFLILIKVLLFKDHILPYVPTLKVDLVALPDVLKNQRSQPHREKPLPLKETGPSVTLPPRHETNSTSQPTLESKNKRALDRLKTLAKIQDFRDDLETVDKVQPTPVLHKGNRLSKGHSVSGEAREADQSHYFELLRERLRENFSHPRWLSGQDLSAQVKLILDDQGNLKLLRFVKSSGNTQFDGAVKRAVEDSQPFPLPPEEIQRVVYSDGVLLGFPL